MKVHSWTYKKCMKDQILKFRNGSNYSSITLLILSISIDNGRIKFFSFRFDFFKPQLSEHCTIIIIIIIFALFIQYRWKYINNIFISPLCWSSNSSSLQPGMTFQVIRPSSWAVLEIYSTPSIFFILLQVKLQLLWCLMDR